MAISTTKTPGKSATERISPALLAVALTHPSMTSSRFSPHGDLVHRPVAHRCDHRVERWRSRGGD
jgi:hypothetical protein